MLVKHFNKVLLMSLLFLTFQSNAALMTVESSAMQTEDGENYSFDWPISDWLAGTTGELVIEIQGDLGYGFGPFEGFDLALETLNLGTHGGFEQGLDGWTALVSGTINGWRVTRSFEISAADMAILLADNQLTLSVDLDGSVNIEFGFIGQVAPYIKASFSYMTKDVRASSVPEPVTAAILGLGLLGFYRKKQPNQ